jgi:hypothetical protein
MDKAPYRLPVGLSAIAGKPEPFAVRFDLPVEGDESATATFWCHPLNLADLAILRDAGYPACILQAEDVVVGTPDGGSSRIESRMRESVKDPVDRLRRNLLLLTACGPVDDSGPLGIIDRERGWESLKRIDGSEWQYRAPAADEVGTTADPRVMLARVFPSLVDMLAFSCERANLEFRQAAEGNSASLSDGTPDAADKQEMPKSSSRQSASGV